MPRAAIFLDRDGTLNVACVRANRPYPPDSLEKFVLLDGVADGCARLKAAGFVLVVATNQPDVGRGFQTQALVEAMHDRLRVLLPEIDLIQVCYHAGAEHGQPCSCRKPQPFMLLDASARLSLDLRRCWMIGDRWRDIDCGHAAGCRTIHIDRDYAEPLGAKPNFTVRTFSAATAVILENM